MKYLKLPKIVFHNLNQLQFTLMILICVSILAVEKIINTKKICADVTKFEHHLSGFNGQWNWIGNTLNPYYEGNSLSEMIDDDRLIIDTLDRWHFGADNTGNIMNHTYSDDLQRISGFMQPLYLVRVKTLFQMTSLFHPFNKVTIQGYIL